MLLGSKKLGSCSTWEVPGSNFSRDMACSGQGFPKFASISRNECRNSNLKQAKTASFTNFPIDHSLVILLLDATYMYT
jgi:hypothetical protein